DFPCGMSQEMCLPLALAWAHAFPGNPYHRNERLRELAIAGIEFAKKSSHSDGSCDDYFPYEQALGALVFSTWAMAETYRILAPDRPDLLDFLRLRGDWLREHNETGQLANHQAYAALALRAVFEITGDAVYEQASKQFQQLALSWQNEEGWFQEYEGADPGYHTTTITLLAKLYRKTGDESLKEPLLRAIEFAAHFMHPDGSYAGEYGSRNTYHFYSHGFELMAPYSDTAARIAQTYLQRSLPERRRYFNDDDRMCAHYVYDWMLSWLDYHPERKGLLEEHREPFTRWFPQAKLLVKKTPRYYAVVSMAKGGVIKVFDEHGPLMSDTGVMVQVDGQRVLVSHLVGRYGQAVDVERGLLSVSGNMAWRKHKVSSPAKQIAFRSVNMTVGRLSANALRATLQKVLITGKPWSDARFHRTIELLEDDVVVRDTIDLGGKEMEVTRVMVGSDATSIYVANSNTYQESVLLPWREYPMAAESLRAQGRATLPERRLGEQKLSEDE
ncbi:MAG TPA: hypothetical protein PLV85_16285, partial [Polyangiaceae bacterium]|nr:hypothetical protein [Polyangiaceae bacterium]